MPAASISMSARRDITAFRSAVLIPFIGRESSAMASWRGNLDFRIGRNAFLIACPLHDAIVVWEALPEFAFQEEMVEFRQGGQGHLRSADRHRCAHRRIEHPSRHDNRRTGLALNQNDIDPGPLLRVESPNCTAVESVPAVVDRHFLPDTGRITS